MHLLLDVVEELLHTEVDQPWHAVLFVAEHCVGLAAAGLAVHAHRTWGHAQGGRTAQRDLLGNGLCGGGGERGGEWQRYACAQRAFRQLAASSDTWPQTKTAGKKRLP